MNWIDAHLNSVEYLGDFYMPRSGSGGGGGDGKNQKHNVGDEQLRQPKYAPPRVIEIEQDFPRLQKFYDDWEQFLDWVDWRGRESERISQVISDKYYKHAMTHNFQEAMNLARYGWRDALCDIENLEQLDLPIKPTLVQSYDISTKYSVAGGAVNIGRYLAGMPDCMRAMHISDAHALPTMIQKVFVIPGINEETSVRSIMKNGYMVYQIIDAMEQANIRTDVIYVSEANKLPMHYSDDYYFYEAYINIKRAGDPFYPEKLLFQLAHPSMFRRIVASERERNSSRIRIRFHFYRGGGYGAHLPEWHLTNEMARDALVINMQNLGKAISDAKRIIKSQYDKIR